MEKLNYIRDKEKKTRLHRMRRSVTGCNSRQVGELSDSRRYDSGVGRGMREGGSTTAAQRKEARLPPISEHERGNR